MLPKTRPILKIVSIVSLATVLIGCAHVGPNLHGQLWQGDSKGDGIYRAEDKRSLKASDPLFDGYTCQTTSSLQALLKSCKEYY